MVPWNSASGGFAYNWQSKWVGIIAIKTERTQIHFLSDVLVAVASLDLKVPYVLWGDNDVSLDWWYNIIIYDELPRKKKLARILDKREISVEPFKLNKRPGRLLDHLRYHVFSCLFRCHSPWVPEVFSRGFAASVFGLRPNTCRPAADETKLPTYARKNLWYPG